MRFGGRLHEEQEDLGIGMHQVERMEAWCKSPSGKRPVPHTSEHLECGYRDPRPMTTTGCGVELAFGDQSGANCVPVYRTLAAIEDKVEIKHNSCTLTAEVDKQEVLYRTQWSQSL